MTTDMQNVFRKLSEARGLWAGAEIATHQDLSALFAVRTAELYLRKGGRFGLVLPNAAIDREHYAGFRKGNYGDASGRLGLTFEPSWDLRRIRPHFFPRAACVVFGARTEMGSNMTDKASIWTGRLSRTNAPWSEASNSLSQTEGVVRRAGKLTRSPYASAFTQGATLVPRLAFIVEEQEAPPLGLPSGRLAVRSSRSVQEKKPWKGLPGLSGVVETEFVRPLYTGDNIFAYRTGEPLRAVVPCNKDRLLEPGEIELHPGLQQWWERAEDTWNANRSTGRLSLKERLDYQSTLTKQLPVPPLRVVYNRAGMHVVAAKITNRRALIASGLYWAAVHSENEANYLCAIMNAPATTDLARPFMSYGKDERDIHKHIFEVPIPTFDPAKIGVLGAQAERLVRTFTLNLNVHFSATRRHIRDFLAQTEVGREIDELVYELLS